MMKCVLKFVLCISLTVVAKAGCPAKWLQFKDKCYFFSGDLLNWYEASYLCKQHHALLATAENEDENIFLKTEAKARTGIFWLGAMDDIVEGDWRWMSKDDDIKFNFTDWGINQPDNIGNNEDCLALYQPYQYHWIDAPCFNKYHFICERSMFTEVEIVG